MAPLSVTPDSIIIICVSDTAAQLKIRGFHRVQAKKKKNILRNFLLQVIKPPVFETLSLTPSKLHLILKHLSVWLLHATEFLLHKVLRRDS